MHFGGDSGEWHKGDSSADMCVESAVGQKQQVVLYAHGHRTTCYEA
ncbi:hypothetical protein DSM100238_0534 [Bifidobacterium apri]|uniref:Uncharacterized protein n=1 Tax=Bifidobacterium apri TaxID=1769423 RepID=A0A6A2W4H9_9BIFI|nr:hypothetical protein DSM100238_0534 [Bifidobacterium apri]